MREDGDGSGTDSEKTGGEGKVNAEREVEVKEKKNPLQRMMDQKGEVLDSLKKEMGGTPRKRQRKWTGDIVNAKKAKSNGSVMKARVDEGMITKIGGSGSTPDAREVIPQRCEENRRLSSGVNDATATIKKVRWWDDNS